MQHQRGVFGLEAGDAIGKRLDERNRRMSIGKRLTRSGAARSATTWNPIKAK